MKTSENAEVYEKDKNVQSGKITSNETRTTGKGKYRDLTNHQDGARQPEGEVQDGEVDFGEYKI